MPRFGIKSALIAFAVIAIWMVTLRGYSSGRDVRACIMVAIAGASFVAAIYCRGRRQAFWIGFSLVIVLLQLPLSPQYELNYYWLRRLFQRLDLSTHPTNFVFMACQDTAIALATFCVGIVVGYVGVRIYDGRSRIE